MVLTEKSFEQQVFCIIMVLAVLKGAQILRKYFNLTYFQVYMVAHAQIYVHIIEKEMDFKKSNAKASKIS